MRTRPTVENAATWFNAKTVTHRLDVVDRQAASIVDTCTAEGSTVRFTTQMGSSPSSAGNWSARATRKTVGFTQS